MKLKPTILNMACAKESKEYFTLKKVRELAEKMAKLENNSFVIFNLGDGSFSFERESDFKGEVLEYIFP